MTIVSVLRISYDYTDYTLHYWLQLPASAVLDFMADQCDVAR